MPRDFFGNIIRTDIMGNRIPKKQIKREVIAENRDRGKRGEDSARFKLAFNGYEDVKRSHKGRDFIATKTDLLTGKKKTIHVEVKTGKAKLSPLQRKEKLKTKNYIVMRESGDFW
jgi:hypothetical protein